MTSPTEQRLADAFRDLVEDQPFTPDTSAIERLARQSRRRARITQGGITAGVFALTAVVAVGAAGAIGSRPTGTPQAGGAHPNTPSPTSPSTSKPVGSPLVALAADLANEPRPTGDATLVERDQAYPNGPSIDGWDLYTDDGRYFYASKEAGLPAQIKAGDNQGDGVFAREVAAAIYAVNGDLNTARYRMAWAPQPTDTAPASASKDTTNHGVTLNDNYIWENSQDALIAGSGNPQVRAGVLRLLSTLPEVTVTDTTLDGQSALTLTAGAGAVMPGYQEALTINADTGVPLKFVGGLPSDVGVTVTYASTRVTLAAIEAGRF
ncbi:MAG TPA: hypothetical protein VHX38_14055 [Pseudonocardiaceae bacterium]|jgi:hypothetical protein|nr:hypothetical protein [Pseudonocardiaceae bacterium]